MSALAATQSRFLAAIFGAEEPRGPMAIHRRNALSALVDALAAAHPAVRRLVGEAFFDEAARRYALATPSRCGDLHAFGDGFGAFLEAYPFAARLAYLGDVARLEWAVHACFHADDAPALDPARLGAVDPEDHERLRLHLHPAARLVRSRFPVQAIRAANVDGGDGTPARLEGDDWLLVRRDGGQVAIEALAPGEWWFLERLQGGEPLGAACAAFDEPGRDLAPCLARHARAGLFARFELAAAA